jgi:hypothetical protein
MIKPGKAIHDNDFHKIKTTCYYEDDIRCTQCWGIHNLKYVLYDYMRTKFDIIDDFYREPLA